MTRTRHYDLIAFDWDGTLSNSTAIITRSIQEAVRDVGGTVPSDEAAAYVIGMNLTEALAHAAPDVPRERYADLGQRYRHHWRAQLDEVHLFAGAQTLLEELKSRGYLLAVATGKSRDGLDDALQRAHLTQLFDATRTADQTAGKPSPLMLQELMQELGTQPARTLMVGDTTHDLQMAINANCPAVGVAYGAHPEDGLEALAPLYIAHTVPALGEWLRAQG